MDEMNITSAQYLASETDSTKNVSVRATIDGETLCVPLTPGNRHYDAILKWVADGNTIQDAD